MKNNQITFRLFLLINIKRMPRSFESKLGARVVYSGLDSAGERDQWGHLQQILVWFADSENNNNKERESAKRSESEELKCKFS